VSLLIAVRQVRVVPSIYDLQRGVIDPQHRPNFIRYSAYDAEGTWLLHEALDKELKKMTWVRRKDRADFHTMREYFDHVMVPFGETLTDMERRGIKVDAKV
jgi:DNA polymerase-1